MAKPITSTYRAEYTTSGDALSPGAWDSKVMGRPSNANAQKHGEVMTASFQRGGCNYFGDDEILFIRSVTIVRQSDNMVVAEWAA